MEAIFRSGIMLGNILNYIEDTNYYLRIIYSLLIFLALYIVMILVFRIILWTNSDGKYIVKRFYFQSIGFILSFSIWWILLDLPRFKYQLIMVKLFFSLFIFFFSLLILDILNYLIFDIYTLRVRAVKVPNIISTLFRGIYFLAIILVILASVLNVDIRPFLTGSAILTAIIGLALQDTLGNLFSGLALHISRPFDIGQWIKFLEVEGTVAKIDWRATTIKTREEDYVTIPNSHIAKTEVINFSTPTTIHAIYIEVGAAYDHPPGKVKQILEDAALKTDGVVKYAAPEVYLKAYNDSSINYKMRFFIEDYRNCPQIRTAVMEKIWYMFRREGIVIPFPIRNVYMKTEKEEFHDGELVKILEGIDFLQCLNNDEISELAKRVKVMMYSKGEIVIRQGEYGDTFYIIKSGKVRVVATDEKGDVFLSKDLYPGNFFGEISVLTGEPRSATVDVIEDSELLVLHKQDFEPMLRSCPDLDSRISEKIASRQRNTLEQLELSKANDDETAREKAREQVDSLSQQILSKIRNFFSIE